MNRSLWDFALATYARTGVEAALLALQDEQDVDVLLVLYALWLEERGELLTRARLDALEAELGDWRREVIEPVRSLRRQWRSLPEADGLRQVLKDLELQAERRQLEVMEALHAAKPCELSLEQGTNLDVLGQYWALDDTGWLALKAALALA